MTSEMIQVYISGTSGKAAAGFEGSPDLEDTLVCRYEDDGGLYDLRQHTRTHDGLRLGGEGHQQQWQAASRR